MPDDVNTQLSAQGPSYTTQPWIYFRGFGWFPHYNHVGECLWGCCE